METENTEVVAEEVAVETVGTEAPENTPEENAPDPEPEKPSERELELSEKFNQVTERERVIRESEETNKSAAEELKVAQDILAKFKENPLEGLKAMGVDFKDVANLVLNDEVPTAEMQIKKLREEITSKEDAATSAADKALQTKNEELEKYKAEEQEKAITTAHVEIKTLIDGDPEKFELIKNQNAYDMVFDIAGKIYQKTKVLPEWGEVAVKVEEQIEKEMEKYFETDKFKSKYQRIPEVTNHNDERDLEANFYGKQMIEEKYGRSLTNQMTSDGAKPKSHNDYRTDEESKEYLAGKLAKMLEA